MKVKTWLFPLVLFICTLAVVIAVFFPLYRLMYTNECTSIIIDEYGWFSSFATLDPVTLAKLGYPVTIATFITITGVFAKSYLVLAFVGLIFSAMIILLRVIGIEFENFDKISKAISAVLLIGTIGFIVSAILFICLNQSGIEGISGPRVGLKGTFALWTIIAGLLLATIASFLARHDIMEEDAEVAEKKAKALAKKLAREENNAKEQKKEIKKKNTKKQNTSTRKTLVTKKTNNKTQNKEKIN